MSSQSTPAAVDITSIGYPGALPEWLGLDALVAFLHRHLQPYADTPDDIRRGLIDALAAPPRGGDIHLAHIGTRLVGAVVVLRTGMAGYVPENLLLFAAVADGERGQGHGRALIERAIASADGSMKLHVEPGNPARRLYERLGFRAKYLDLRLER